MQLLPWLDPKKSFLSARLVRACALGRAGAPAFKGNRLLCAVSLTLVAIGFSVNSTHRSILLCADANSTYMRDSVAGFRATLAIRTARIACGYTCPALFSAPLLSMLVLVVLLRRGEVRHNAELSSEYGYNASQKGTTRGGGDEQTNHVVNIVHDRNSLPFTGQWC